ncbi:MAG TPA: hypothetical protein VF590_02505 [Isosphaeraceae bacterium]
MRPTLLPRLAAAVLPWALAAAAPAGDLDPPTRVVIPFDFESRFDDGATGRAIGEMIWAKLRRQGGFILPESMRDVRDWCRRNAMLPGPDTPLERMKAIVRTEQAGDIAIWGKVERVPGAATDAYDLSINVADVSTDPARMIYANTVRTRAVSEIPHAYVQEALDRRAGRAAPAAVPEDPARARRWEKRPNLVTGDFERGTTAPLGWDPLPAYAAWIPEEGQAPPNRIIRFSFPEAVAGSTGVLYYSDDFPVEEGATYRFQCRWRSTGSAAKVFIKGYDAMPSPLRTASGAPVGVQRREVYRSQQNLQGDPGTWNVHTQDFTPRHTQYTPRWARAMLSAYWPAGTVD